jgi:hypothetical protein
LEVEIVVGVAFEAFVVAALVMDVKVVVVVAVAVVEL